MGPGREYVLTFFGGESKEEGKGIGKGRGLV